MSDEKVDVLSRVLHQQAVATVDCVLQEFRSKSLALSEEMMRRLGVDFSPGTTLLLRYSAYSSLSAKKRDMAGALLFAQSEFDSLVASVEDNLCRKLLESVPVDVYGVPTKVAQ